MSLRDIGNTVPPNGTDPLKYLELMLATIQHVEDKVNNLETLVEKIRGELRLEVVERLAQIKEDILAVKTKVNMLEAEIRAGGP